MNMWFDVVSASSGSEYRIDYHNDKGRVLLTCTCPAGEMGQYCKHRFALLDGNTKELQDSSAPIEQLIAEMKKSEIWPLIEQMKLDETAVKKAQATLKASKKRVAKAMYGVVD